MWVGVYMRGVWVGLVCGQGVPSCRLDCLLIKLDKEATTVVFFLNLQKKQVGKHEVIHLNSDSPRNEAETPVWTNQGLVTSDR